MIRCIDYASCVSIRDTLMTRAAAVTDWAKSTSVTERDPPRVLHTSTPYTANPGCPQHTPPPELSPAASLSGSALVADPAPLALRQGFRHWLCPEPLSNWGEHADVS